jgi:dCMP deaminase
MDIAHVVARRSNCSRRQVAAVIVHEKRIISTGYNGTPRGVKNCFDDGCPRCASDTASGENLGDCICAHAEENSIVQAAYHGISVRGGTLYCTISPCLMCSKMIINAGITEVVYEHEYQFNEQARELFEEAGVRCRQFSR